MNANLRPLTWQELLRVNLARLFGDLRSGFVGTSPLPTRAFVALATAVAALGLWFAGEEWLRLYVFEAMRMMMPRWMWALLFTAGCIGQAWRMLDDKPRIYAGIAVNAHVAVLWLMVTIALLMSGSLFVAAAPFGMFVQSVWVALRTGATCLDRRRA